MTQELSLEPAPSRLERESPARRAAPPPAHWYRTGRGHLFLSTAFGEQSGAPHGGEIQGILVALRWEPLDGRDVALYDEAAPTEGRFAIGRVGAANRGSRETWRLFAPPAVGSWRAANAAAGKGGALHLLELCSCATEESGLDAVERAALEAYKDRGGRAIHKGEGGFFWFRSYHLAVFGPLGRRDAPGAGWRSEGGAYRPPSNRAGPWRRRWRRKAGLGAAENSRPADSFDPQASYGFDGPEAGIAGADPSGQLLSALPMAKFRPFVARLVPLSPWPPFSISPALPDAAGEAAGLEGWYRRVAFEPVLTWRYSPALLHAAGTQRA
ncbi:MAG: hypothetical protein QNJ67_14530 [Kiloniellales bacterium]|nr:hypothetical protein [Kiloniellales bacterium]